MTRDAIDVLSNHYDCPLSTVGLTAASTEGDINAAVERELEDLTDNYGDDPGVSEEDLRDFLAAWVEREGANLTAEIVSTVEMHANYELPDDGFSKADFVEWVMEGVGDDMVREGHKRADVLAAASEAYELVTPRFRTREEEDA